jgi:hydroxypyruvate reductase
VSDWIERLLANSSCLTRHAHGRTIAAIAAEALAAVDPRACVLRSTHLLRKPTGEAAVIGEFVFDLAQDPERPGAHECGSMHVFGAGKASAAMASALVERFGSRVAGGLVIVKHPPSSLEPPRADDPEGVIGRVGEIEIMLGDHPIPGARTAAAAARLRDRARRVGPRDLVLCPCSGGASALLSEPTLAPDEWAELHALLLARDVSIQAINRLRRRFDVLKAGGLAQLLAPATVVGLIISDVVGDELALVGSGPTVYPSEHEEAEYQALLGELDERLAGLSEPLRRKLDQPPPLHVHPRVDGRPQGVHQVLLARNGDAREAACRRARAEGLDSIVLLPALGGLAANEGRRLARLLATMPADLPVTPPCCLVTGGETTVALGSDVVHGLGGRNQELALAAIEGLAGIPDLALLTLATDGEDGPTDAAGALITGESFARAQALGIELELALAQHDSHQVFARLGDLIRTGPTGTNVCDLALLFRFARA